MLCPSDGVADRRRLLRARSGSKCLGRFEKNILGYAAIALHHFGGVAREVAFQNLEYALRIFHGEVPIKIGDLLRLSTPVFTVSAASLGMSRKFPGVFPWGTAI